MPSKIIFLLILSITLLACSGCASMLRYDGPYEGKVVDAETGKPIEGAVVHGKWVKRHLGGGTDYYDSYEMLTDKDGNFKIPGQGLLVLSEIEELHFTLFKAGYEQISFYWCRASKNLQWNGLILWNGNHATFNLKKLTMEERRKRTIDFPSSSPLTKKRLLRMERNKEYVEIGIPKESILPVE